MALCVDLNRNLLNLEPFLKKKGGGSIARIPSCFSKYFSFFLFFPFPFFFFSKPGMSSRKFRLVQYWKILTDEQVSPTCLLSPNPIFLLNVLDVFLHVSLSQHMQSHLSLSEYISPDTTANIAKVDLLYVQLHLLRLVSFRQSHLQHVEVKITTLQAGFWGRLPL